MGEAPTRPTSFVDPESGIRQAKSDRLGTRLRLCTIDSGTLLRQKGETLQPNGPQASAATTHWGRNVTYTFLEDFFLRIQGAVETIISRGAPAEPVSSPICRIYGGEATTMG